MNHTQLVRAQLGEVAIDACCAKAEWATLCCCAGRVQDEDLVLTLPNDEVCERAGLLLEGLFGAAAPEGDVWVLAAAALADLGRGIAAEQPVPPAALLQRNCCKQAFLRMLFLWGGNVTWGRDYRLELTGTPALLTRAQASAAHFDCQGHLRGTRAGLYWSKGETVADMLSLCGAHAARLLLEEESARRITRAAINRGINRESANQDKTASASARQRAAIRALLERGTSLPPGLQAVAQARLTYPEATLEQLAEHLDSTRSAINHALRRLMELSE